MHLFNLGISIILTLLSCITLSYISMATMIGPWIAPTLVLIAGIALRIKKSSNSQKRVQEIALIQTVGSIGGIIATGVGFTLPTLYFLDKAYFDKLLAQPLHFCTLIAAISIAAGSFGILLARTFTKNLLGQKELSFPVSQLIHKTITSQTQSAQAKQLLTGFSLSTLLCFIRDGLTIGKTTISKLLPTKDLFLFSSLFGNKIHIILWPMLWAIGFIAGTTIALPLIVGLISKYLILHPLNIHSYYLPVTFFPVLDKNMFSMSFCSGLIFASLLPGVLKYPQLIWNSIKQYSGYSSLKRTQSSKDLFTKIIKTPLSLLPKFEALIALVLIIALFSYFQFPLLAQIMIILLTVIATYQINYLGGKIGLIQFGRFTTFVMIPTMLLFKLNPMQITLLCVFVSICIATSSDLLFDYKVGELCQISIQRIYRYQWLGLIITALSLGFFLWILFTNLQLGTAELFAQRAKHRAILIQLFNFNWTVMLFGFLFGLILKRIKMNPFMVLGGILMPNSLTIGLSLGALGTLFTKDKARYIPFFSGIFTGESIWLILSILTRMI